MLSRTNLTASMASAIRLHKTDDELRCEILAERTHPLEETVPKTTIVPTNSAILKYYFVAGDFADQIVGGKYQSYYNIFMVVVISLAAISVGIGTYQWQNSQTIKQLFILDAFVVAMFTLEFVLAIMAEKSKPQNYFIGNNAVWNIFDFLILFFSILGISDSSLGDANKSKLFRVLLRLVRLVRVMKLLKQIPSFYVILKGLMAGMSSILYILVVMFLFTYLYGVVGSIAFGQTDPFFFQSTLISMLSLFHATTFDNWTLNLYISMYGCSKFNGNIYPVQSNKTEEEWANISPPYYRCNHTTQSTSELVGAALFWVSYMALSGLILLSLFIGVITISMQSSLDEVRTEAEEVSVARLSDKSKSIFVFPCIEYFLFS